ncbi:MAG: NAD(P)H-dependent oxidoreductase subunit E [Nitriliruptorales bacterium]
MSASSSDSGRRREMSLSERTLATADRLVARYPQPRSALLPLLYLVQAEEGRITDEGIAFCAQRLGLTKAEVQAVQTFYEMYEREDPGDWLITVCTNFSCKVRGGRTIYERLVAETGGGHDREHGVAVKHVECLGNCEDAPVVQVNYNNYARLDVDGALALLEACRRGEPPAAADGNSPPTFREVSWRLSGAVDDPVLHRAAVESARADVDAEAFEKPPAERIFDTEKRLGSPGVRPPGPEDGDAEDLGREPDASPPESADPDAPYPGPATGIWGDDDEDGGSGASSSGATSPKDSRGGAERRPPTDEGGAERRPPTDEGGA